MRFRHSATLGAAVLALGLVASGSSVADTASEVAAIRAVNQAFVTAYNSGDVDSMVSLYDEHAVVLPPGAPGARGRTAIRAYLAQDVAASVKGGITLSFGSKEDDGVSGSTGWASGTYLAKDKSGHVVETGKFLSVYHKKDGKWLYYRDTWNSDGPPPPTAPAKK